MTKFAYTILAVQNLAKARKFYEEYFDQEVDVDMGKLVGFKSGLALWEEGDMARQPGLGQDSPVFSGRGGVEIEFHTEDIQELYSRLQSAGVKMVHDVIAHPWEQRVFRCLDSDGHCLEVDEYLWTTARRLVEAGRKPADIAKLFGVAETVVEDMLRD